MLNKDEEKPGNITSEPNSPQPIPAVQSLRELIDLVSGRSLRATAMQEDSGLAEILPFPFLGIVGQMEMKLALLLSLINPHIGGVLLIGPRGTGKTTAVRSLLDLLPEIERSACYYGCMPVDIESGGIDAVCPDCAKKFAEGLPLTKTDKVHIFELPLNARLEDVIGQLDEHIGVHEKMRFKKGILALADLNILFVDEVNLLGNEIIDAILDASAHGLFSVRRGPLTATYKSRFTLVGSMNPEEGSIRPQIMDRFGLRVIVRGLEDSKARLEAYNRVNSYKNSPRQFIGQYAQEMELARNEIISARQLLPRVLLSDGVAQKCIQLIRKLRIDSLRAEITLFEAAKALAAADGRLEVQYQDITNVAPMALRLRKSKFMTEYLDQSNLEKEEMDEVIHQIITD